MNVSVKSRLKKHGANYVRVESSVRPWQQDVWIRTIAYSPGSQIHGWNDARGRCNPCGPLEIIYHLSMYGVTTWHNDDCLSLLWIVRLYRTLYVTSALVAVCSFNGGNLNSICPHVSIVIVVANLHMMRERVRRASKSDKLVFSIINATLDILYNHVKSLRRELKLSITAPVQNINI